MLPVTAVSPGEQKKAFSQRSLYSTIPTGHLALFGVNQAQRGAATGSLHVASVDQRVTVLVGNSADVSERDEFERYLRIPDNHVILFNEDVVRGFDASAVAVIGGNDEDLGSANQVLEYFLDRFCVLQVLRERLRCKEIWMVGANRYRNPDEDLPTDFEAQRGLRAAVKSFLTHHEVFALLFAG